MKMAIERSRPKIAIVGAGLAGLSAGYYLRSKAEVTIFEASEHAGGRVLTSPHPRGEHGAEFLLKSEGGICRLLKVLGVKLSPVIREWPAYLLRGRPAWGEMDNAVKKLLLQPSANYVVELFDRVRRAPRRKKREPAKADLWLSRFLRRDKQAIRFVSMLLAGETCAPLNHLSTDYVLGCLWSSLDDDEWYRINEGSEKLVVELLRQSQTRLMLAARVNKVVQVRRRVQVRWTQNRKHKSGTFQAAIIAIPQGERILGKSPCRHHHSYLSILLEYSKRPRLKTKPAFDLANGLYTDGPLNYLQITHCSGGSYVLRILIPNAGRKLSWTDRRILSFCTRQLRQILVRAGKMRTRSVERWRFGLPCGGSKESFRKVSNRVYLAGDGFGKWPSMDAAVTSGQQAAKEVVKLIG